MRNPSWAFLIVSLPLVGAVAACRKANLPPAGADGTARDGAVVAMPQRSADADPRADSPTTFDVDEKTGRSRAVLVLRLDYFPDPQPGVTNLPVCYPPFPETFDVGVAVCDGNADVRVPVLAKNLDQDCYTDPAVVRTFATQPLVIPGCKRGAVLVHAYAPRLRVDVEVKDVN